MKKRTHRWMVWSALAVALALVVAWTLRPRAERVELAVAERGTLEVSLAEEGETRVRERFVVSAPVAGRLLRIELEPGDPVEAGQTVLATFEPLRPLPLDARARAEAEANHLAAHAALDQARAYRDQLRDELDFASAECARYETLAEEAVVSAERAESVELEAKRCEDALAAGEHAVRVATHRLTAAEAQLIESGDPSGDGVRIPLHAPIDGVVLRRLRESESTVASGEPLLEIGEAQDLEIVADFLSSDAVQIHPGDTAWIERWGGPEALEGRVRRVEPSGFLKVSALGVEEQRVNVILDLETPPEARAGLADGYRVDVRVVVWQQDGVLTVPVGSTFRSGDGWAVFRVEDERARFQPVEVGRRGEKRVQILEGLAEGDEVILHPPDRIADGVLVARRGG